jgi:U3 small nucleolar RNA-associated protein MPP10
MSSLPEQSLDISPLERMLSSVDVFPDTFLQPSASLQSASLVAAKRILDPVIADYSVFRELALRGLDVEQVWEQVRLVGEKVKSVLERQEDLEGNGKSGTINVVNNHVDDGDSIEDTDLDKQISDMEEEDEEDEEDGGEDGNMVEYEEASEDEDSMNDDEFPTNPELDEESEDDAESATPSEPKPFKKDVHGLNDEFFSIDDFNRLTEQQDNTKSDDENVDEIDYFAGIFDLDYIDNRP